ncbi:MAG: SAM-dependent methyltransferase [Pseudomonadota bacterium]
MFKVNPVDSNQLGVHPNLIKFVSKQQKKHFSKPFSEHTNLAFEYFSDAISGFEGEVILDACCGVGESTLYLSKAYPDCLVVGIDRSAARLDKNPYYNQYKLRNHARSPEKSGNTLFVRANLVDFWRLLSASEFARRIKKQYILYPNPYPKKAQLGKRWYASPVMKDIVSICKKIECRSNWSIYLEEFQRALSVYDIPSEISRIDSQPITPFERKYQAAGQACWKLITL